MIETKTAYLTQYGAFTLQIQDIYEASLSVDNFPCEYTHKYTFFFRLECQFRSSEMQKSR